MIDTYRRFAALGRSDQRLVIEAALATALFWAGLRVLGFRALLRIRERSTPSGAGERSHSRARIIKRVHWAVTAVAARFPSATCLVQALAADALLRRRGLPCQLRLGVRSGGARGAPIEAHAWVECDGTVAMGGGEHLSSYEPLTAPEAQ